MNADWSMSMIQALISGLLSGSVIAFVAGLVLRRKAEQISAEVKQDFEHRLVLYRSEREWNEQALSGLLGPMVMQFGRTKRAFNRWHSQNLYIEARVVYEGNKTIRDLLLQKGHLIPPDLLGDAHQLVAHYDLWLEEYERLRGGKEPRLDEPFVYAGPRGIPFPSAAERRFMERFEATWKLLYGQAEQQPGSRAAPERTTPGG